MGPSSLAAYMRRTVKAVVNRTCWWITGLFPIQRNKIVVVSFYGRGFSDNAKPIVQELHSRKAGFEIYWAVKDINARNHLPRYIKPVKYEGFMYVYHMRTAGIWIDNCRKWSYVRKKSSQLYINTYHALPFKQVEQDAEARLDKGYVKSAINDSKMADVFISNSSKMTEIYRHGFWYDGDILECGFPRNDVFFGRKRVTAAGIKKRLGIPKYKKLVLYAPTFRKDESLSPYDLNYAELVSAFRKRFDGEWHVLLRLHPNIAEKVKLLQYDKSAVTNVTDYPDMQELLVVSDALITDYSSSILDYLLTQKPSFMYANDIQEYKKDRDLYFPIKSLPFSVAKSKEALHKNILEFNYDSYEKKVNAFTERYGFKDDGLASSGVVDWILENRL